MSRIPSRSRQQPLPSSTTTISSAPSRLVLSTPPELLSWLVDDLRYLPPSSSASGDRAAVDPWGKARETKELKLVDVTRFCRGSIHILLHHLSLHLLGRTKTSNIRSEIHRLQSPSTTTHLSRPTLQTLFPPSNSSHQLNRTSLANLSKLDARLVSLQSTLDALLSDETRKEERTDEETISLKIKRDVLQVVGEGWAQDLGTIEALGEMIELEGGGKEGEERFTLLDDAQKTLLSTLLQSISSYIDFPSKYTEPSDLGSRLLQIPPEVLLEKLRVELERSLKMLSVQTANVDETDPQHARDALLELHLLHLSLLDDRRVTPPRNFKRIELEKRLDEKLRKEFGADKAGIEKRRTEILTQIDSRAAGRTKPNLVDKLSSYGQILFAGRVETKEKLLELEEERCNLLLDTSSLQAAYDALVASSQALAIESQSLATSTLPASLKTIETSLSQLDGTLERELAVVRTETWETKVERSLGTKKGADRKIVGQLIALGEVGVDFNGLYSTLTDLIKERSRLRTLYQQLSAPKPPVEDHSGLLADLKTQAESYTSNVTRLLVEGRERAEEQLKKTKEEFETARREREAVLGGRFLRKSTREREGRVRK